MKLDLIGGADPTDLNQRRTRDGEVFMGYALVAGLLAACQTAGVSLVRNCHVEHLSADESRIAGVVARNGQGTMDIAARGGVVLANGGFEWTPRTRVDSRAGPDLGMARRTFSGTREVVRSPICNANRRLSHDWVKPGLAQRIS